MNIKSIIHRLKRKDNLLTTELIERKALESVMPRAEEKTRQEICEDCLDRRCLVGRECKAFDLLSKTYAWDMVVTSAELN